MIPFSSYRRSNFDSLNDTKRGSGEAQGRRPSADLISEITISRASQGRIIDHLLSTLPAPLIPHHLTFLPKIKEFINEIFIRVINDIRGEASSGKYSYKLTVTGINNEGLKVIALIFDETFATHSGEAYVDRYYDSFGTSKEYTYLLPITLEGPTVTSIPLFWTPDNPYIYMEKTPILSSIADDRSISHYHMAREGKDTNCKINSGSGTEFQFHKTFLFSISPYFERAFKGEFKEKEAQTLILSYYSDETILNLQHFVYLGDIHPDSIEALEHLTKIIHLAHELGIPKLYARSLELIANILRRSDPVAHSQIEEILVIIFRLELPDTLTLLFPCLRAAEKLEDVTEVRWHEIPTSKLPALLSSAASNSLIKVQSQLEKTLSLVLRVEEPVSSCGAGAGAGGK